MFLKHANVGLISKVVVGMLLIDILLHTHKATTKKT